MAAKKTAKKKPTPPPKPEYKYDVARLAKDLDILPASVRVALRKARVSKNKDGVYGWNAEADYKKVLNKLQPAA